MNDFIANFPVVDHLVSNAAVTPLYLFEDLVEVTNAAPAMVNSIFLLSKANWACQYCCTNCVHVSEFVPLMNILYNKLKIEINLAYFVRSGYKFLGRSLYYTFCHSLFEGNQRQNHSDHFISWLSTCSQNQFL